MSLFELGNFTLASGQKSDYKIDCDSLTDDDIETIARMIDDNLRIKFRTVEGVPTGGLKLAEAMKQYATPDEPGVVLIVDDVWTTGSSMRKQRANRTSTTGAVIFARGRVEPWVLPLFTMYQPRSIYTS